MNATNLFVFLATALPPVLAFRPSRIHPKTTLAAPSGRSIELFPSDDSDYESANASEPSTRLTFINTFDDVGINNTPTQSKFQMGTISITDPVDVIADWVAEKFVEQSLQSKSSNGAVGGDAGDAYILESYSPGSTLSTIAKASHPYIPLSYQMRTVVRVMLPSLVFAAFGTVVYPSMAQFLAHLPSEAIGGSPTSNSLLYTDEVLTVLSNDLSQYVQNILTTCALLFGMLVGQTYYFMYQQQEHIFFALFKEVTEAKSLLEQISLMAYGRESLYPSLLSRMDYYVQNDLKMLSVQEPTSATSRLPKNDPLESILYATSVGVPGVMYENVKSLRQARAARCGALQRKLPNIHIVLLRLLGVIVLSTFPICGSGSQAIAPNVLVLQSYMFGILVFGLTLVINVVEELRNSRKMGAYNADGVLAVMVGGLEEELQERLSGKIWTGVSPTLPVKEVDVSYTDAGSVTASLSRRGRMKDWLKTKLLHKQ
ncbi:hypothetical protein ACHAWO_011094 [Cyclotella atomus]|uniref:ABC transmembrane type-1 domain-containing protein n=1 Tax=Cyclotella atomus TaxID=382360 RepID=A0ABD3MUI5_9STRA